MFIFIIFAFLILNAPAGVVASESVCSVGATDSVALYGEGNGFYESKKYESAIICYNAAIASGMKTGDVYYNLGNSFFRNDQLGRSILNFQRALRLSPLDKDYQHNLEYALSMAKDKQAEDSVFEIVRFSFLSARILFYIFASANIIFWLLLSLKIMPTLRWGFLCIIILLSPAFILRGWQDRQKGVVVGSGEVKLRSSPSNSGSTLFVVHEGLVLDITDHESNWKKVSITDGKRGWVGGSRVERIF